MTWCLVDTQSVVCVNNSVKQDQQYPGNAMGLDMLDQYRAKGLASFNNKIQRERLMFIQC